ncbi:hypothetical protein [Thiohalobacter sp.]|uniref:hypothetical protein n=1 Tax=Thiohalobacter sp. TaxID=2025948 RepID=UPI00261E5C84|nr:hypothetical protein [Thiohalobacter sp.]
MTNPQMLLLLFGLEVGLAAVVLGGLLWWRRRQQRARSGGSEDIEDEDHPPPSLYLERELALTRSRIEALGDAAPDTLRMRLAWLGLEREIAEQNGSGVDEAFWEALPGRIETILPRAPAAQDVSAGAEGPEVAETSAVDQDKVDAGSVIERQARTIDYLRGYIAELVKRAGGDEEGTEEVEARFAEIERVNRELKTCVQVLEDENQFLRDQIGELLKME